MNRGKTALKRGVAVASVAAMAIAGAVLAAPAASATTLTAPTMIRATPIADAALINTATNEVVTAFGQTTTSTYSTTGALPTLNAGNGQPASGIQVFIPGLAAGTAFEGGDSFSISLSTGATFASGSATISGPFAEADLDKQAGYSNTTKVLGNTTATVPDIVSGKTAINPNWVSAAVQSDGTLKVTFANKTDPNAALGTTNGYLVSINGVKVNIANDVKPGGLVAKTGGVTSTIGYISPFTLKAASSGYTTAAGGDVKLPDVTVSANSKNSFTVGGTPTVSVSGDQAVSGTDPTYDNAANSVTATPTATLTLNGGAQGAAVKLGALTTADAPVTTAAVDTTRLTSYALSGLLVKGLKKGADVTLELTVPNGVSTADTSLWSESPNQTDFPSVTVSGTSAVPRMAGANRNDTAAKIAAAYVDAASTAPTSVVLANGTNGKLGIDALSANFLAGAENAPILLTDSTGALPKETVDALTALFKNSAGDSNGQVTIYIMGKTDSVSQAAEDQAVATVKAAVNAVVSKVNVVRVAGNNRYETSAAAVTTAGAAAIDQYNLGKGFMRTAFLASGAVNADALAAGGISAGAGIPVLLANGDTVDPSVSKAISDLNIQQLIVLGGTDRVTQAAIDGLTKDHGVANVVRIAGSGTYGRYDTAALLNNFAYQVGYTNGLGLGATRTNAEAYLANGTAGFPDALAVGPLAGLTDASVYTVPQNLLPDLAKISLQILKAQLSSVEALGQTDRIADSVVTAAQGAIS